MSGTVKLVKYILVVCSLFLSFLMQMPRTYFLQVLLQVAKYHYLILSNQLTDICL
ncbi:hypothetical protein predicted by Glimmer/Critica [Salmonella enterica subsp. enterica serovar Weltevreden str. 2007-60-3289-1]|nr:hypothetical protein predicted by Glimmer/Critica [Salmonella enterica subsp. enterica serovar Weltevreden str. 2007-60-3289-1]